MYDDEEIEEKRLDLLWSLDGSQPCIEEPDKYIENWTGRPIPDEVAERLCAGCKPLIKEKCLTYAVAADEELGIWGGTTVAKRREIRAAELADDGATASRR